MSVNDRLEAELYAIELALVTLEAEYNRGEVDVGRYLRLKTEYEIRKAALERALDRKDEELEELLTEAQARLDEGCLDGAIELLSKYPDYPDNEDIKRLYLEALYRKGVQAYVKDYNLPQARKAFQKVVNIDPFYKDAAQLLHDVEQRLHLETLYRESVQAYARNHLSHAKSALKKALEIDPSYEDATRLLHEVEQRLIRPPSRLKRLPLQIRETLRDPVWQVIGTIVAIIVLAITIVQFRPDTRTSPSPVTPSPVMTSVPALGTPVEADINFAITFSDGIQKEIPEDGRLSLRPGETVLIKVSVSAGSSPLPHDLTYRYSAQRGRIPEEHTNLNASYTAPEQAGQDVITVSIIDQKTGVETIRNINVTVEKELP